MRIDYPDGKLSYVGAARDEQQSPRDAAAGIAGDRLIPSLHWWRTLPAPALTGEHMETLGKTLSVFLILGEPQWKSAVAGDAAAAVGVALRVTKDREAPTAAVDIVMTALLRPAVAGDPAAALVLAAVIDRLVGASAGHRLATSWLDHARLLPDDRSRGALLTFTSPGESFN
jgi:hypothetical protein